MEWRKVGRFGTFSLAACVMAVVSGCGGLQVTVTSLPVPARVGQPLIYFVTITNTLTCDVTDPGILLVPVAQPNAQLAQLCAAVSSSNPDEACATVQTAQEAQIVGGFCCQFEDFATQWPGVCDRLPVPSLQMPDKQTIENSLKQRSIEIHAQAAPDPSPDIPSATLTCTPGIPITNCTGTIAAGETVTVAVPVIPTMAGSFETLVFSEGPATCGTNGGASGGLCLPAQVAPATAAPAASLPGLAALVVILGALGLWTQFGRKIRSR